MKRKEKPHATGRTPIYDFDEWSRNHYGNTFDRKQRARTRYDNKVYNSTNDRLDNEKYFFIFLLSGAFALMTIFYYQDSNYDAVVVKKSEKKNEKDFKT